MNEVAVESQHYSVQSAAKSQRVRRDRLEDRLDVCGRARNNAQDLARRCLLLERLRDLRVRSRQRLVLLLERGLRARKPLAKPLGLGLDALVRGEQLRLREISCEPLPRLHDDKLGERSRV